MFDALKHDPEVQERVRRLELPFNRYGIDPYGIDRRELVRIFSILRRAYEGYFTVEAYGVEHVPKRGRAMLVGNHSGGLALDATMVLSTCFFELEPPRLAQGMVEKFLASVPGASQVLPRIGQFTGLPEVARRLLEDDRMLMVFPEGARGTAKLAHEADTLVSFGTGFMRLALQTGTPIVPMAFLGGGDAIPTVANLYRIGRLLGIPYVPVTSYLVPLPRPTTFQLLFSQPMAFEGDGGESDETVLVYIEQVRSRIRWLIEQGRDLRDGRKSADELELR